MSDTVVSIHPLAISQTLHLGHFIFERQEDKKMIDYSRPMW